MTVVFVLLGLAIAAFIVWWLFIETEGVYLGKRVVTWLYDLYARRYDRVKQFDAYADQLLLAQPLLDRVHPQEDPRILDVATGTGRLPMLMAHNARFAGTVMGLDRSSKMLDCARSKVAEQRFGGFISLARGDAMSLPFPDDAFDMVTCLEALEFFPDSESALAEMCRVLRPDGLLLTSNRIDTRWMPGRRTSEARLRQILRGVGMVAVEFEVWQEDYTKVWARKADVPGRVCKRARLSSHLPSGKSPLTDDD